MEAEEVSCETPLKVLLVNPELGLRHQIVLGSFCLKERLWEQSLLEIPSTGERNTEGPSLTWDKEEQGSRLKGLPFHPCYEPAHRAPHRHARIG